MTEDSPNWPEMATDLSIARSVARAITLDTQRSSTDGRVMDLSTELQTLNGRLLELEKLVADQRSSGTDVAQLATELDQVRANLAATNVKFDDLATRSAEPTPSDPSPALLESVAAIDERVAVVEAARQRNSDEVSGLMEYLEQAFTRLDEVNRRVDEMALPADTSELDAQVRTELDEFRRTLEEMRDVVASAETSLDSRLATAESNLANQVGIAEENLAEQVRQVQEHLQNQVVDTERTLAEQVAEARAHLDARADQAQIDLDARLGDLPTTETLSRAEERFAAATDATRARLDELEAHANGANQNIDHAVLRADEAHTRLEQLDERVSEVQVAIVNAAERLESRDADFDELARTAESAAERVSDAHTRLAEAHQRINDFEAKIDEAVTRANDANARVDDIEAKSDGATQRADDAHTRIEKLHKKADTALQRSDEAKSQLEELTGSVRDAAQRADEAHTHLADLSQRLSANEDTGRGAAQLIGEATLRSEDALARLGEAQQRLTEAETRIESVEQLANRAAESSGQTSEESQARLGEAQQRLTEAETRIEAVEQLANRAAESSGQTSDDLQASVDERLQAAEDRLLERIEQAREQLAQKARESEESLVERVKGVEESLSAGSAAEAEQGPSTDPAELAQLREDVQGARTLAADAQRFSENLRVLQTDLVKAIQVELEKQSERLGDLESTRARVQHLETTLASLSSLPTDELGIAPVAQLDSARLAAIETQLADATSSIEGLAELQRRTTNLDTSLTQSMSNMTQAVEQNSAELRSLRAQLDAAQTRITQLETGKRVDVAPPAPTPHPPPPADEPDGGSDALRVADVIGETTKNDRLTPKDDSDWFVASYTKKEKGRRFRR